MTYEQIIEAIAAERRWQVAQNISPSLVQVLRHVTDLAHALYDGKDVRQALVKLAATAFAWLEALP